MVKFLQSFLVLSNLLNKDCRTNSVMRLSTIILLWLSNLRISLSTDGKKKFIIMR